VPERTSTVGSVFDSPLTAALDAVVHRARSLQWGVMACRSLPVAEGLEEARLVLLAGLRRCTDEISVLLQLDPTGTVDSLLLLAAERYWLEALLAMLEPAADVPRGRALDQILEAFPGAR